MKKNGGNTTGGAMRGLVRFQQRHKPCVRGVDVQVKQDYQLKRNSFLPFQYLRNDYFSDMKFDINSIKEKFKENQFCLDLYRNIHPFVVLEDLPDDVEGQRIIFGKRTGIEIIRHDAGKADVSFQFRTFYDSMNKLENLGHTRIEVPGKARLFPVVTVVVKEEINAPVEKIGRDMKNYYKANTLLLLKFEGTRRERENFDRDLFNYGVDVVFGNELSEVNVHVRDEKLLEY